MISLPTFPEQVPLLPPAPPVPDLGNLLRGIAWLGMANARHVQRVWLPDRSIDRARVLLVRLQQQGLVDAYRWYVPQSRTARRRDGTCRPVPPHDGGYWWFVTRKGAEFASTLAGEPVRSVGLRAPQLVAHDRLVVNALVQMLLLARPHGLSGAYVEREALLNPPALKPRMDAVVVLRLQPDHAHSAPGIPWTTQPPLPGEHAYRFALEIDNNTEGSNEIAAKALAYRHAAHAAWAQRTGAFPVPVWVAPHAHRRDRIHALWQHAWPDGHWLLTTDTDLLADRWWDYRHGQVHVRSLFASTRSEIGGA